METMPPPFWSFSCSKKINREGGIFRSLHEKQEGELIFLLMLLEKLRAYLVIVLKEVQCSVCQEGGLMKPILYSFHLKYGFFKKSTL